jgi:hypothetical protein
MKLYESIKRQNQEALNKVAKSVKVPDSRLDQLLKVSRKRYRWAIGSDVILIIAFVLTCTFSYGVLIHGAYNGEAIHCIPEIQNESYEYWSSEGSSSEGEFDMDNQIDELDLYDEGTSSIIPINEINERCSHSIMNPELKGPISSLSSKRSNRSQRYQDNLLNLKNYEKNQNYRGRKSADSKLMHSNVLKA